MKMEEAKENSSQPKFETCTFFIAHKNRRCKMQRKASEKFCTEHMSQGENGKERIPCPADPSHTVWKHKLDQHLKKCNKIRLQKEPEKEDWFKKNYNWQSSDREVRKIEIDYKKWIPTIESAFDAMISKYGCAEELPLEDKSFKNNAALSGRFEELENPKHITQQSSLIGHMDLYGLCKDAAVNYVEFGCGKAEFSRYVAKYSIHEKLQQGATEMPNFLLIDRATLRMKMDTKIGKDFSALTDQYPDKKADPPHVERVKTDIKDLVLDKILGKTPFKDYPFVGISKHLCGCATDLTLQCIENSEIFKKRFGGLFIAMCCRHVCNYWMLLPESREFLESLFKNPQEAFEVLKKMVSWATCGRREGMKDEDVNNHPLGLSVKQRELLGSKARRIVDESRVYAMEKRGWKVKLSRYVESNVSLENVCMEVYGHI